jgi:hypothetical protein
METKKKRDNETKHERKEGKERRRGERRGQERKGKERKGKLLRGFECNAHDIPVQDQQVVVLLYPTARGFSCLI